MDIFANTESAASGQVDRIMDSDLMETQNLPDGEALGIQTVKLELDASADPEVRFYGHSRRSCGPGISSGQGSFGSWLIDWLEDREVLACVSV